MQNTSIDQLISRGHHPDTAHKSSDEQSVDLKLLVFDMGKVFIHFDWERTYEGFVQASNKSVEDVKSALEAMYHPYERGHITTDQFVDYLNGTLGTRWSRADFARLWTATLDEDAEMTRLMQSLKEKYPLYLLSNINETSFGYLQDRFNVAQHFEELVLSYKVGHMKPAAEIYHEVLNRSQLPAQHCLFIDDLAENIQGPKQLVCTVFISLVSTICASS